MNIGLLVEVEEGLTWERWRPIVAAAESLGFESLWLSDHLCSPWTPARRGLDAWVALTVAAAESSRITLGTLVSPVTFRPPGVLARMAESVQALSGGRLTVGLGLGWNMDEHHAHGIPFPPIATRAALLEQTVRALGGIAPVVIGGKGERWTLPLVARLADEWNVTTASVDVYRASSQRLAELCESIGRQPGAIRRSIAVGYLLGADTEAMARWVPPLRGLAADGVREMGWVVGSSEAIVEQLQPLAALGVERAILGHYAQTDLDSLKVIADEVLPRLR